MRIYKYQLFGESLEMPAGAEILTVQMQNDIPCIWALVNPSAPLQTRHFILHGTGHHIDSRYEIAYIGTFQQPPFVWHLFEEKL